MEPYWRGDVGFGATPAVNIVEKTMLQSDCGTAGGKGAGHRDQVRGWNIDGRGPKEEEPDDEKQEHFLSERRFGAFHRSFRVPDGVDADKIEARLKNGVLKVTLPKSTEARRRQKKIAVKRRERSVGAPHRGTWLKVAEVLEKPQRVKFPAPHQDGSAQWRCLSATPVGAQLP